MRIVEGTGQVERITGLLKREMKVNGITIGAMAGQMELNADTLSGYMHGRTRMPAEVMISWLESLGYKMLIVRKESIR